MDEQEPHASIAETLSVEGSFHPDGVNTPRFLSGNALRIWNATLRLQRLIMIVCGAALTIIVFVQVVTRYLLGISIFGIEELATFIAVYLYFIGGAHGAWERGHISASLVDLILPEGRAQHAAAVVTAVVTTVLSAWMTVWSWQYLVFVIGRGTVSLETGIPMPWIVGIIPVCMTLMTMYFAVEVTLRFATLTAGGDKS